MTFEELFQQRLKIAADIKAYWPRTPGGELVAYSGPESLEIQSAVNVSDLWRNDLNVGIFQSTCVWVELSAEGAAWLLGGYLHHILTIVPVIDGTGRLDRHSPFFIDFAVLTGCSLLAHDRVISCDTVELTATLKRIDIGLFRLTAMTADWMLKADELFEQKLFYFAPGDVLQMTKNWGLAVPG